MKALRLVHNSSTYIYCILIQEAEKLHYFSSFHFIWAWSTTQICTCMYRPYKSRKRKTVAYHAFFSTVTQIEVVSLFSKATMLWVGLLWWHTDELFYTCRIADPRNGKRVFPSTTSGYTNLCKTCANRRRVFNRSLRKDTLGSWWWVETQTKRSNQAKKPISM